MSVELRIPIIYHRYLFKLIIKYFFVFLFLNLFLNIIQFSYAARKSLPFSFENKTSIAIFDLYTNQIEYYYNERDLLIPASVMKLVTSINSLSILGPFYTFEIKIYKDFDKIIISSNYNPSLIEEIVNDPYNLLKEGIKDVLLANGVEKVKEVYLDSTLPSYFPESWKIYEGEPFAPYLSTFSFNQNMIKIQKKNNGFIIYPPVFDELRDYNKLSSMVSNLKEIDGAFWYIHPSPQEYNKRVIKKIFKDLGYEVDVKFLESSWNKNVDYLGSFPTANLLECLRYQNFWSDNFIAQQIYNKLKYEIGFDFSNHYKDYGITIDDGCGLSRKNRISTYFLAELLSKTDDFGLLDYLIFTLPGYAEGTLEKRDLPPTVKAKTGTLSDVSSLAGYIKTLKGKWYSFTIIYNGPNVYNAKLNEEKLLNYIYKNW